MPLPVRSGLSAAPTTSGVPARLRGGPTPDDESPGRAGRRLPGDATATERADGPFRAACHGLRSTCFAACSAAAGSRSPRSSGGCRHETGASGGSARQPRLRRRRVRRVGPCVVSGRWCQVAVVSAEVGVMSGLVNTRQPKYDDSTTIVTTEAIYAETRVTGCHGGRRRIGRPFSPTTRVHRSPWPGRRTCTCRTP